MKYREAFDHLGNPHYVADREGVFIVIGVILCIVITTLWLKN
jgi:hypothetical protein